MKVKAAVLQTFGAHGRFRIDISRQCKVESTAAIAELRLSPEDIAQGYALACQTVIESDISVTIPLQEKIERRLTTDRTAIEVSVPLDYDPHYSQTVRRIILQLAPPRIDDQTDDWSRLQMILKQQSSVNDITISLPLLRQLGTILREEDWRVTAIMDAPSWEGPDVRARLIDLKPGHSLLYEPLWGVAIDIGTTTVSLWLVDLVSGKVHAQVAEYNGQISRGEDVISRIIYAGRISLTVAIIAVIFYNYFQTRIGNLNALFRIQVAKVLRNMVSE